MHAEHFLERLDRLDDHEVPDALALYYNPPLVRQLLAHAPERGHGDRVAISLDDPREGPFIIVTQNGDFVTTLGRGMSVGDLPVVPRSVWDAARRRDERFSENFAQARAVSSREARLMWDELMTRGPYFSRESMSAALAFSRLLDTTFVRYWAELNAAIASKLTRLATREGYRALDDEGRATLARRIWALGNLSVLVGGSEVKRATEGPVVEAFRELPLGSCSIRFGMLGPYLRALWATGKLGALTFDAAKRVFRTGASSDEQLDAGLSLAIIGHRFRKYRGEVAKILAIGKREHEAPEVAFRRSVGEVTLASLEVVNAREDVRPKLQEIGARLWVDRSRELPADHPLRMNRRGAGRAGRAAVRRDVGGPVDVRRQRRERGGHAVQRGARRGGAVLPARARRRHAARRVRGVGRAVLRAGAQGRRARAAHGDRGAQAWAERAVLVRQRPEVQAVLWAVADASGLDTERAEARAPISASSTPVSGGTGRHRARRAMLCERWTCSATSMACSTRSKPRVWTTRCAAVWRSPSTATYVRRATST